MGRVEVSPLAVGLLLRPFPGQGGGWWSALHTSLLACPPAFLSSHPGCRAIAVSPSQSWPPYGAGSGRCSHPSWGEAKPQAAVTSASPASSPFVAFAVEFLFSLGSPYPSTSGSAWASSHAKTWSLCLGWAPGCPWAWLDLFLFPLGLKALPDLAIIFSGITASPTWVTPCSGAQLPGACLLRRWGLCVCGTDN